ncbi:MAG: ABC transporter ATP-binding protein [Opitutaceae bacterium]|nr:ABC transporter ATP-binding protein [Opitutaceae bacterium]
MDDTIIRVEALSKKYHLGLVRHDTLRDHLAAALRTSLRRLRGMRVPDPADFWALRDVSFDVKRGEVLGIIGRNGAGKSTLLKILSRITEPTTGRVTIRGRVASLLEVGTGFHPELTGRENIFLNGAILGMTQAEIRRKFDEIVAFAEVERFIDTPVKHYSSGMYMRLAFAVAAHLEPEILIIDEVLAVGDLPFQKKCLGKIQDVASGEGRTVLFVSHNTAAIAQLCTKGLVLQYGRVAHWGTAAQSLAYYSASFTEDSGSMNDSFRILDQRVAIADARINGSNKRSIQLPPGRDNIEMELEFTATEPLVVTLEARLLDQFGGCIAFFCPGHTDPHHNVIQVSAGRHVLAANMRLPPLHRGTYQIDLALVRPGVCYYARAENPCFLHHSGTPLPNGNVFEQSAQGAGYQVLTGAVRPRSGGTI